MTEAKKIPVADAIASMSGPLEALIELQLALIGHLHDRGLIDAQIMGALLQKRIDILSQDNAKLDVCSLLVSQIDWLDRIGTGLKSGENLA